MVGNSPRLGPLIDVPHLSIRIHVGVRVLSHALLEGRAQHDDDNNGVRVLSHALLEGRARYDDDNGAQYGAALGSRARHNGDYGVLCCTPLEVRAQISQYKDASDRLDWIILGVDVWRHVPLEGRAQYEDNLGVLSCTPLESRAQYHDASVGHDWIILGVDVGRDALLEGRARHDDEPDRLPGRSTLDLEHGC